MIAYGQVDGRARRYDATEARTDQWTATVADPEFWVWLQGHALACRHVTAGPISATFQSLATVAGDLLEHRAEAVRAQMRGLDPSDRQLRAARSR